MSFPQVVAVAAGSPGERAGIAVGDEIRSLNGRVPRDILEFATITDEAALELEIGRGGVGFEVALEKLDGEPLGVEVSSPLFDRVRTCDNHCAFCFIYQLPKGLRKSLYVKDDDYRLSFLYGNFTTLTRFTELDLERVVTERLSPLCVSIHATDPDVRAAMLRNRRGATSLRWLRALLDHGIEVHGQIVVCPGVNDGAVLDDTCAGIFERFPELATAAAVPLGVSRYTKDPEMRPHTRDEAKAVLDTIGRWQERFATHLGRRLVYAADEYYLLAGEPFPAAETYDGFTQHENGIGMSAAFAHGFATGRELTGGGSTGGFFASIDGAPAVGYRAPHAVPTTPSGVTARTVVLTGRYGALVLGPLLDEAGVEDVAVVAVENEFFGGNIGVAGLLTGADFNRVLETVPAATRVLVPDVCVTEGRFLDGVNAGDLVRPVEFVETTGSALRRALGLPTKITVRRDRRTLAAASR